MSRFSDIPFSTIRDKDGRVVYSTPGADVETVEARRLAWEHYNETGDDSKLRELGLLPEDECTDTK